MAVLFSRRGSVCVLYVFALCTHLSPPSSSAEPMMCDNRINAGIILLLPRKREEDYTHTGKSDDKRNTEYGIQLNALFPLY